LGHAPWIFDPARKSARHYEPVIEAIAAAPAEAWDLDADSYTADTWPVIQKLDQQIREAFGHRKGVTSTLATKVMLGVFGNVPAFDTYFRAGFRAATFGPKAFGRLGRFYAEHTDMIERHRIPTLDFHTGEQTLRQYSCAKIIDMIFFIEGAAAVWRPDRRLVLSYDACKPEIRILLIGCRPSRANRHLSGNRRGA
jgi:hypothetical protein